MHLAAEFDCQSGPTTFALCQFRRVFWGSEVAAPIVLQFSIGHQNIDLLGMSCLMYLPRSKPGPGGRREAVAEP
jgi:hypothetical protein